MVTLEHIFFRRPRILNVLHRFGLAGATSQTNEIELNALARFATGRNVAVEIGSYQGVSAARIAKALSPHGVLFCVDPWTMPGQNEHPNFRIFQRHIARTNTGNHIKVLRGRTQDVVQQLPERIDFAFIDGDHSLDGIRTDWEIISPRLILGGIVCFHDAVVPDAEPWRVFDSVEFYAKTISQDPDFELLETIYSMRVLRKTSSR